MAQICFSLGKNNTFRLWVKIDTDNLAELAAEHKCRGNLLRSKIYGDCQVSISEFVNGRKTKALRCLNTLNNTMQEMLKMRCSKCKNVIMTQTLQRCPTCEIQHIVCSCTTTYTLGGELTDSHPNIACKKEADRIYSGTT